MAEKPSRRIMVAPHGKIASGPLTGWRYAIMRFERVRTRVAVIVHATPPHWPFPTEVRLAPFRAKQLQAVPGEGVKRMNAWPEIAAVLGRAP